MRSAVVAWLDGETDMKIPNGHAVTIQISFLQL
jgi:hypothetical protein